MKANMDYDYSTPYYYLFRAITKGLERLEELLQIVLPEDFVIVRDIADIASLLKEAQCAAEDMYIECEGQGSNGF